MPLTALYGSGPDVLADQTPGIALIILQSSRSRDSDRARDGLWGLRWQANERGRSSQAEPFEHLVRSGFPDTHTRAPQDYCNLQG